MSSVAVDASVWIAAHDARDPCCPQSRSFFANALATGTLIHVPAFARVELACALSRKLRNAARGQRLASLALAAAHAREHPVNAALLARALSFGASRFLRGADALYCATADLVGCDLVSWDEEHIERAGALTPQDWLIANP
jgi:predicted nucleic acid-binding protein